ncbi:hypothetical protein PENTCL1PPCAC_14217, partial [Pristionchus entomophagus]
AIVTSLLLLGCAEARVDFTFSKVLDEYDFWGESSVTVDGLCRDTCHLYASITEESRTVAANILVQTPKGFMSIADIADRVYPSTGLKIDLQMSGMPTLTIINGNSGLKSGPLVLYIVNTQAPNFAGAEVYEAEGMLRSSAFALNTVTVMSARPFTLKQAKLEGSDAWKPQGVRARLTGFDALSGGYDSCVDVYNLNAEPFPGFTMEVNGPIISLIYDYNQYTGPAGELSATVGITNALQMLRTGFFNSVGFHGCAAKQAYKSSLYNYNSPSRVDLMNETPQNVVVDVLTNTDEKHAVQIFGVPNGETNQVFNTNASALKYFAQDIIVTWQQDGIVDYHYLVRYNSTIV